GPLDLPVWRVAVFGAKSPQPERLATAVEPADGLAKPASVAQVEVFEGRARKVPDVPAVFLESVLDRLLVPGRVVRQPASAGAGDAPACHNAENGENDETQEDFLHAYLRSALFALAAVPFTTGPLFLA